MLIGAHPKSASACRVFERFNLGTHLVDNFRTNVPA
jgi:hypothetical protein